MPTLSRNATKIGSEFDVTLLKVLLAKTESVKTCLLLRSMSRFWDVETADLRRRMHKPTLETVDTFLIVEIEFAITF